MKLFRSSSGSGSGTFASAWAKPVAGTAARKRMARRCMGVLRNRTYRAYGTYTSYERSSLQQLVDLRLGGRDQGVELRDFLGVLPLLVLAEPEQVGLVLRPPAVEVQLVLLADRCPQPLHQSGVRRRLRQAEHFQKDRDRLPVAVVREVQAVVGQVAGRFLPLAEPGEQVGEVQVTRLGEPLDGVAVHGQPLVLRGRVREWSALVLQGRRTHQDVPGLRGGQFVQQLLVPLPETVQPRLALKRFVRPVADNNHRRLLGQGQLDQALAANVRLVQVERLPGRPEHIVPAPAEVAHFDPGIASGQHRLPVPVALLALDQRGADEDDPVRRLEFQRVGGGGRRQGEYQAQEDEGEAQREAPAGVWSG